MAGLSHGISAAIRAFPLALVLLVSALDFRTRRVPNVLTLPAMILGALAWPPDPWTILPVALFAFALWRAGVMGGGDAKLWIALAFWTPPVGLHALFAMGVSAVVAGLAFLLGHAVRGLLRGHPGRERPWGIKRPAAWQAIPYALWLMAGAPGLLPGPAV